MDRADRNEILDLLSATTVGRCDYCLSDAILHLY